MATFSIESNGRLEKTVVYFNGEQLGGIKEVFLNLDEEGAFDAILQYEGSDKKLYTKQIFEGYLENVKTTEPSFTEEEAEQLQILTLESEGAIESSSVFFNEEPLEGIVSLFVHIKAANSKTGIRSFFSGKSNIPEHTEFLAEITFRNEDGSVVTENVF
ncbi:MAG: hypothetical protein HW421_2686 [Ignavibacteria bacterium]|nr:hypothetical protein [Ignavibacteria bacterium]